MKRKLASIQKIESIEQIKGADRIVNARVMGWNVVVLKDEFQPGDRCVFFEIDAVLPEGQKWTEFLRSHGFRVKSMRLKGVLSQGLALPMHILPGKDRGSYKVGTDVTDMLGVTKYEPPMPGPEAAGPFPGDVPKTDELRLQSMPGIIDEIRKAPFYATVKLDGMSGTFVNRQDGLQVCTRNILLKEGSGIHWSVADKYNLRSLPIDFAVQGEVVGPNIQKNRLELKEHDLFIFNVYDIKSGKYLDYDQFVVFCHKHGLKTVPIAFSIDAEELESFPFTIDSFLQLAEGTYDGTKNRREGIVIRPQKESFSAVMGNRLSFKVISNSFLLNDEE